MLHDPQGRVPLGLLGVLHEYACGALSSRALSGRPFRRFVTRRCEKCGLALLIIKVSQQFSQVHGLDGNLISPQQTINVHQTTDIVGNHIVGTRLSNPLDLLITDGR